MVFGTTPSTSQTASGPLGSSADPAAAQAPAAEHASVAELTRALRMFRGLLESQVEAILIVDDTGTIVIVNEQAERLFGYRRDELLGQPIEIVIPERLRGVHAGHRDRYVASPHARPMGIGLELTAARKDGSEFAAEISLSAVETEEGLLITSRISDITPRKRAEAALREAEEHFRLAFEHTPIGMAIVALDGRFQRVNRALCEITGYEEQWLLGSTIYEIAHVEDADLEDDKLQELLNGAIRSHRAEQRLVNSSGHAIWTNVSVSLVRDGEGAPLHFIVQIEDISGRKLMEERLRRLADYDSLTGVRNRRQFERDLFVQVGNCQRYGEHAALLMIDLDAFKQINDTYGHQVGDDVLKAVAAAIRKRLRSTDTVARFGGDEFAVLLPHVTRAKAEAVAADLVECIASVVVHVTTGTFSPRASIGVAHIDQTVVSKEAVLGQADDAMYSHKHQTSAPASRNAI